MQYKKWLEEWLVNYVEPSTKLRAFSRYSEIVKQHIAPSLGNLELGKGYLPRWMMQQKRQNLN